MQYSISEVAKKLNIPVSTIRYYEKSGMLPPITRHSGIRVFSERDLCVLKNILTLKQMRMPLKDIKSFCYLFSCGDITLAKRNELIEKQRQSLLNEIEDLKRALSFLEHENCYFNISQNDSYLKVGK